MNPFSGRGMGAAWRSHPDLLYGRIDIAPAIGRLLKAPGVRRLDRLRQLPDLSVALPAATHTRLVHSLGVMHLAGCIFDRLIQRSISHGTWWAARALPPLAEEGSKLRVALQIAALLHDIGHGPFSHAFDHILRRREAAPYLRHEARSTQLVLDESVSDNSPGIAAVLKHIEETGNRYCSPESIALMIRGLSPDTNNQSLFFIGQIVSSEIDADRMDYLPRDALTTGVSLGHIDPWPLIDSLTLHRMPDDSVRLALPHHAEGLARELLLARSRAYEMLYNSPDALAAHELLLVAYDECFPVRADPKELSALARLTDEGFLDHLEEGESPLSKDIVRRLRSDAPYLVLPVTFGGDHIPLTKEANETLMRWRTPIDSDDIARHRQAVKSVSKGMNNPQWCSIVVLEEGSLGGKTRGARPWIIDGDVLRPIKMDEQQRIVRGTSLAVPPEWLLSRPAETSLQRAASHDEALRLASEIVRNAGVARLYRSWADELDPRQEVNEAAIEHETIRWLVDQIWAGC
jgi:HD superfamily phosphohydrolase